MKTNRIHRTALIALALAALVLPGCGSDNPTAPEFTGKTILLLEDGGSEAHVKAQLRSAGFRVKSGGLFYEFTGEGLDKVDAVVLLTGVDYNHNMTQAGQDALVSFVNDGGGLLTTEWLCYSMNASSFHQTINSVIPAYYGGYYGTGSETYSVMVDHPVTEGLPPTFATGEDNQYSSLIPKSGAVRLIQGSRSSAAVTTWTRGGRVVAWNAAGEYGGENVWNADTNKLLTNSVGFISRQ